MTDINELLDFLAQRDIRPEPAPESPWPAYTPDMGELVPVDYTSLFPTNGERSWSPEDLSDAIEQIMADEVDDDNGHGALDAGGQGEPPDDGRDPRLAHWDICAWYQQIHFYGDKWGIYIRQDCLIRQARRIYREAGAGGYWVAAEALLASLAVYFLHEHFHHKVESLAIRLQVVQPAVRRYPDYFFDVYNKTLGSDDCLEEALANAESWKRLFEPRHAKAISYQVRQATRQYLEVRFPHDPPGYRMARFYLQDDRFRAGLYLLSSQVDEATRAPSRVTAGRQRDWYWAPQLSRSIFSWASRIHLIVPPGARPALPHGPIRHVP